MRTILIAAAFALSAPVAAFADHAHGDHAAHAAHGDHGAMQMLAGSTPADGAVLAGAPRSLALTFAHPVILRTVSITGPAGPVRANFRRPSAATASYSVALPALAAGAYEARWTASGEGHDMEGVIRFTIQ